MANASVVAYRSRSMSIVNWGKKVNGTITSVMLVVVE
jgi:hypothetical protein